MISIKEYKGIRVDELEYFTDNPNKMSTKEFDRLKKEILDTGFVNPIIVYPLENGKYKIVGGYHRFVVAKDLKYNVIPSIVLDVSNADENEIRTLVVKLNTIKGQLDMDKLLNFINNFDIELTAEEWGDVLALDDYNLKQLKKAMLDGLGDYISNDTKNKLKKAKTIDDLKAILNSIFDENYNWDNNNLLVFGAGGGEVIYINLDKETFNLMKEKLSIGTVDGRELIKCFSVSDCFEDCIGVSEDTGEIEF